ncbi:MAG TPA: hypothetical protein ENJ95_23830 [Bacteroidetes bacterium]|nr:hypothetical protein [Bacteroidota bacterium]
MYEDQNSKIEQIISEGYEFKFGDYIGNGFNLLQKDFGNFFLFSLVSIIIMFVVALVPILGIIADVVLVSPALIAGLYIFAHKLHRGEPTEFSDFFKGFNYAGQLVLVTITAFLVGQILSIPYYIANSELYYWYIDIFKAIQDSPQDAASLMAEIGDPPQAAFWTNLLMIPSIYIGIAYAWAVPFVIFYKLSFWDALETSRRLITKRWWIIFAFMIVIGLIAGAGIFVFCIGLLASFPAYICMNYLAFEDVTQLNVEGETEGDIEQHLVG